MKATALYATLCLVLGSPAAFSKSEDQARCPQCVQKDRKISELQGENARLKGLKETPALIAEAAANEKVTTGSYVVRPGDTLERIARRTNCSAISLGKANGLKSSTIIHPGQILKVPVGSSVPVVASKAPASTATSAGSYTIKDGDTYTSISKKTGVSVNALTAANPKVKATSLRTGQVIQLRKATAPAQEAIVKSEPATPVHTISAPAVRTISNAAPLVIPSNEKPAKVEAPKVEAPKPKPEKAPEPQPTHAPAAPKEEKQPAAAQAPSSPPMGNATTTVRSIIIQDETTFGEFAMSHGTSPAGLNELNGLSLKNETVLAKGSELYIPAQP
jgi:LysM repeat protein